MTAAKVPLEIEMGATKRFSMTFTHPLVDENGELILDGNGQAQPGDPYNFVGATARSEVRITAKSSDVRLSLTTENGGIILGNGTPEYPDGSITLVFTDAQTDDLGWDAAGQKFVEKSVYDVEVKYPSGDVDRLLEGSVTISPSVTRGTYE